MTHLLIDGDQFLFKACAAVEEEVRWDDQNHVLYSNREKAWTNLQGMITRIQERFSEDAPETTVCFSSYPCFRSAVDPTYKQGRSVRKPLCYAALREQMEMEGYYECRAVPGLEADDVMGIMATHPRAEGKAIIASQDKDMKTIPSTIWNGKDLVTYTEAEADYWHMYQTLVGDATDGYKGCPGVGPKKAEALLVKALETGPEPVKLEDYDGAALQWAAVTLQWAAVTQAYAKAGLTEEHALTQARLSRILRYSDWNSNTKEPILWEPNA